MTRDKLVKTFFISLIFIFVFSSNVFGKDITISFTPTTAYNVTGNDVKNITKTSVPLIANRSQVTWLGNFGIPFVQNISFYQMNDASDFFSYPSEANASIDIYKRTCQHNLSAGCYPGIRLKRNDDDDAYFIVDILLNQSLIIRSNYTYFLNAHVGYYPSGGSEVTQSNHYLMYDDVNLSFSGTDLPYGNNFSKTISYTTHDTFPFIVNRLTFSTYITGGTTGVVSEISIRNITFHDAQWDIPNELPSFNVTTDKYIYCLNSSETEKTINISINATDPEGDIIYYASKLGDSINKTDSYSFMLKSCWFGSCDYNNNYAPLSNIIYPYSDTCLINKTGAGNDFYYISTYDIFGNPDIMLNLGASCTRNDKSLYFKANTPSNLFKTYAYIYNLNNDESFNITLYSSDLSKKKIIVGFEKNATATYIYNYNSSGKSLITSIAGITDFQIYIAGITNNKYGIGIINGTIPALIYSSDFIQINDTTSDSFGIYSITISETTTIRLDKLDIGTSINFPTFSTTPITGITIYPGRQFISFYVTDDVHLTTDYKIDWLDITLYNSEICPDYQLGTVSESIFEYDDQGLTGIPLLLNKIWWFIRFPYNFMLYFGILEIGQLAVTMALIFSLGSLYYKNHSIGGQMSLKSLINVGFILGSLLFLMGLIMTIVWFIMLFLFTISLKSNFTEAG